VSDYSNARASLEWLEQDQRERFRPEPPQEQPRSPLEEYAHALGEARTAPALRVDVAWLR
jgi:hypothetical protein